MEPLGGNHLPNLTKLLFENLKVESTKKIYINKTINEQNFKRQIKKKLEKMKTYRTWEPSYNSIVGYILHCFNSNCKSKFIKFKNNGVPWWKSTIEKEMKMRNKLWRMNIRKPTIINRKNYVTKKKINSEI